MYTVNLWFSVCYHSIVCVQYELLITGVLSTECTQWTAGSGCATTVLCVYNPELMILGVLPQCCVCVQYELLITGVLPQYVHSELLVLGVLPQCCVYVHSELLVLGVLPQCCVCTQWTRCWCWACYHSAVGVFPVNGVSACWCRVGCHIWPSPWPCLTLGLSSLSPHRAGDHKASVTLWLTMLVTMVWPLWTREPTVTSNRIATKAMVVKL